MINMPIPLDDETFFLHMIEKIKLCASNKCELCEILDNNVVIKVWDGYVINKDGLSKTVVKQLEKLLKRKLSKT